MCFSVVLCEYDVDVKLNFSYFNRVEKISSDEFRQLVDLLDVHRGPLNAAAIF